MKTSGNTILITGGGSGIGRELARRFHDRGDTVIVAGRRRAALEETIAGRANMEARELDIEDPAAITDFAKRLVADRPDLNVVINNAGVMRMEDLTTKRDLTDAETTIVTNLLGPFRLTDALIDHLKTKADAVLINVTSGLAFVPLAYTPVYSATKAALHSYTVSLRDRLAGKVEVIELAPPGVQTELTPGQSTRDGYMPLKAFVDEVMGLFGSVPTPTEIVVENVRFLRNAEAERRFDAAVTAVNRGYERFLAVET